VACAIAQLSRLSLFRIATCRLRDRSFSGTHVTLRVQSSFQGPRGSGLPVFGDAHPSCPSARCQELFSPHRPSQGSAPSADTCDPKHPLSRCWAGQSSMLSRAVNPLRPFLDRWSRAPLSWLTCRAPRFAFRGTPRAVGVEDRGIYSPSLRRQPFFSPPRSFSICPCSIAPSLIPRPPAPPVCPAKGVGLRGRAPQSALLRLRKNRPSPLAPLPDGRGEEPRRAADRGVREIRFPEPPSLLRPPCKAGGSPG
jgi:hypothetical protein